MKSQDKRILILTDFKKSAPATLNNTLGIARKLNAKVELFHVKNPMEIVRSENQLIAMRSLGNFETNSHKYFDNLLSSVNTKGIDINYSYSVGRKKKEVMNKINAYNPDLIVVGKRSTNPFKLSRDKLTNYIIQKTSCPVLIASTKRHIDDELSLAPAFYNSSEELYSEFMDMIDLPKDLERVQKFRIIPTDVSSTSSYEAKRNEYLFDKNDNTIETMSKYLTKKKINLICMQWEENFTNDMKSLMNKVDIPLLIGSKPLSTIRA